MGRTGARAINHQHGGRGPKASISKKKASITRAIHKLLNPSLMGRYAIEVSDPGTPRFLAVSSPRKR